MSIVGGLPPGPVAGSGAAASQQTVHLRVQVVDLKSFTLDLQVPTYLPARDLTQRIARDAGLSAYWEGGRRRLYWLRARGRLLQDEETLGALGVVDGELVYLLPEPPPGSGVAEQVPDYPATRGYAGKGTLALVGSLFGVMLYAVGWGAALTVQRSTWTVMAPGLGLGFLCLGVARHLWGGRGNQARVPATGFVLLVLVFVLVFLPGVVAGAPVGRVYSESVPGIIAGALGLLVGWLAWWGAVEPLPPLVPQAVQAAQQAVTTVPCGICGGPVTPDVRADCAHGCGQTFHSGCLQARLSVYRGDPRQCGVCNARVG